jgi:hypothetical protein
LLPLQHYTDEEPELGAVYREILLSYRLLFGKSSKSRKLLAGLVLSAEGEISSSKRLVIPTQDITSPSESSRTPAATNGGSASASAFDYTVDSVRALTTMKTTTFSAKSPDLRDPLLLECTLPITKSTARRDYNRLSSIFVLPASRRLVGTEKRAMSLPSKIFPTSVLDLDGDVQDSGTYSVEDDFAVFGQRLMALHTI